MMMMLVVMMLIMVMVMVVMRKTCKYDGQAMFQCPDGGGTHTNQTSGTGSEILKILEGMTLFEYLNAKQMIGNLNNLKHKMKIRCRIR